MIDYRQEVDSGLLLPVIQLQQVQKLINLKSQQGQHKLMSGRVEKKGPKKTKNEENKAKNLLSVLTSLYWSNLVHVGFCWPPHIQSLSLSLIQTQPPHVYLFKWIYLKMISTPSTLTLRYLIFFSYYSLNRLHHYIIPYICWHLFT